MRYVHNAIVVLALGVLTAGAVYAGVEAVGATALGSAATASAAEGVQTCPATGSTAAGCHATTGESPYATGDAESGAGRGQGRRRGWSSQGAPQSGTAPELGDALSL